jgi:hypothetical protein
MPMTTAQVRPFSPAASAVCADAEGAGRRKAAAEISMRPGRIDRLLNRNARDWYSISGHRGMQRNTEAVSVIVFLR